MAGIGPRAFLDLVKQSGLVEPGELKRALSALAAAHPGQPVGVDAIADHLQQAGLLTAWQREKLLDGKTKGFFLGGYRLLSLLGSGGMSAVYLAEHRLGRHRRAIKVLPRQRVADKSYLDRFYQEGRAAAALNHPNIVRIFDLDHEDDIHFMVMEFVEGTDCQELVRRDGPMPVRTALDCILQAATGLRHAHERKIVHRDVKPSNLLAGPNGVVKVLDLGLALVTDAAESLTILHNDRVMGTADYLAPEQALNSHEVDHRADIYGLGCTLCFLLTGQPPFPDGSIAQRIAAHQSRPAPNVQSLRPDCPGSVARLCGRMMQKNPDDRHQSCREVIAEVRACMTELDQAPAATNRSSASGAGAAASGPPGESGGESQAAAFVAPIAAAEAAPSEPGNHQTRPAPGRASPPRIGKRPEPAMPRAHATASPAGATSPEKTGVAAAAMEPAKTDSPLTERTPANGRFRIDVSAAEVPRIEVPAGTPAIAVANGPVRRGVSAPKWLVAAVIGGMFVILLTVLVVALRFVK